MAFLNIFGKNGKKKKSNKKNKSFLITADFRERNSLLISELLTNDGVKINFESLDIGDFIINDIIVERKTVNDFVSSMINKRLLRQLDDLQQFDKKFLIIEGLNDKDLYLSDNDFKELGGVHPNAIRGFLLSIILDYNVPIIFSKDSKDSARFLFLLAKRQEKKHISLRAQKRTLNDEERLIFLLEGFPNIGPALAKKLIKKFKSLKNIINASNDDLKSVLGKKADDLYRIINRKIK